MMIYMMCNIYIYIYVKMCVCLFVFVCVFFPHTPILHLHRSVQDHVDILSTVPVGIFLASPLKKRKSVPYGTVMEKGKDHRGFIVGALPSLLPGAMP